MGVDEGFDFGKLREHLDEAAAELERRLGDWDVGDDMGAAAYRKHLASLRIASNSAGALSGHPSKRWHVEHGVIVLRLDENSERNSG